MPGENRLKRGGTGRLLNWGWCSGDMVSSRGKGLYRIIGLRAKRPCTME